MTPDAIVVGGGIVGLSAARELAALGARVVVVERRRVGEEASSAAAGMLAPQVHADADTPLLELSLRARDLVAHPAAAALDVVAVLVAAGDRDLRSAVCAA